jgi:hypothetical protein
MSSVHMSPWWALVDFANERGWTTVITARGRLRLTKPGAVVFGPPQDADVAACKATIAILGEADGFMAAARDGKSSE